MAVGVRKMTGVTSMVTSLPTLEAMIAAAIEAITRIALSLAKRSSAKGSERVGRSGMEPGSRFRWWWTAGRKAVSDARCDWLATMMAALSPAIIAIAESRAAVVAWLNIGWSGM